MNVRCGVGEWIEVGVTGASNTIPHTARARWGGGGWGGVEWAGPGWGGAAGVTIIRALREASTEEGASERGRHPYKTEP